MGRDSFKYRVKDNRGGESNAALVSLTVQRITLPPVANAGPDPNVAKGQAVTLDGSKSTDPEHATLQFTWRFQSVPATSTVTDAALANRLTAAPNFTPDVDGVYVLALTVSDDVRTNTVQITATTANVPPNADAGPDQTALAGQLVTLDGSATVTVTLADVNETPSANAQSVTTLEDNASRSASTSSTISASIAASSSISSRGSRCSTAV
jgi:hypothetical protein